MEQLLHYVWKHKLFPLHPLVTMNGQSVEVIDPGLYNRHAGPDFFNAKIRIDGMLWVGNVEIHSHSSDWKRHGHDQDPAYDSVVLHVAEVTDERLFRQNGDEIPQIELHSPSALLEAYHTLTETIDYPACYRVLSTLPPLKLHSWLSALTTERFEQKCKRIEEKLARNQGDWEQAFFVMLARNFGFGVNNEVFEVWAENIALADVRKHRDSLLQIEAIFLGRGGFLEEEPTDTYMASLQHEYQFLRHKFGWESLVPLNWKLLRLRPSNFPHVRLAQLACLYHRSEHLLSQLMEIEQVDGLRRILVGGASPYWNNHYRLGEISEEVPKSLSRMAVDLLIINTVVPFLYAYGKYRGEEIYCNRATVLLESMMPENNYIIRMWDKLGLKVQHAADSQALIQLKKMYCDPRKCLYCRIGYEYFLKFVGRND